MVTYNEDGFFCNGNSYPTVCIVTGRKKFVFHHRAVMLDSFVNEGTAVQQIHILMKRDSIQSTRGKEGKTQGKACDFARTKSQARVTKFQRSSKKSEV